MKFEIAMLSYVADLCKLLDLLFKQEIKFKPDLKARIIGLELIINNPNKGTIIVARDNGELIEMVNILYTVSTALGTRVGMLEDIVVSRSARYCG
jgi:hypothetical protein